jgi:flavodoxin
MGDPTCLIAYYSRKGQNYVNGDIVDLPVGNTEVAARMIQAVTRGDLFRLETIREYPEDYGRTTDVAREELRQNARPTLKDRPKSIDGYDNVFLGYPNWCGTAPMPVFTFLECYDFSGKTIIPFCTHEGSGMGRSESDIRKACPGGKVLSGLAIRGGIVQGAEQDIRRWVEATGLVF